MSDEGAIERRQVLKVVGGAGVVVGLTGAASGSDSVSRAPDADGRRGVDPAAGEGECGTDAVFDDEIRAIEQGQDEVHMLERQTDYPCEVTVTFDVVTGPLAFEVYLTLDGRTPTQRDYDRYTDEPMAGFTIEGETLDPGDEVGALVVATDAPADGGEYLTVLTEQTDEAVQPVAELSVVTDDPTEGEPVTFDGSASFARLGTLESYEWSYTRSLGGDRGDGTGEEFSFVPGDTNQYRVGLEVTDEVGNRDTAEEYIYVDSEDDGGGFCFITTATAREQSTLDSLRRFRDDSMATTPVGRGLVGLYYRISPPVARALERHPEGRTARLCRWYVRRCAALSDRQRDLDSRPASAALGALIAALYVVGVLIAITGYAGIRLSELLS